MKRNNIGQIFLIVILSIFTVVVSTCQKFPLNPWDPEGLELGYVTSAPSISAEEGVYNKDIGIEITCEDPDAIIYYTTDGSDPDESSDEYGGAIDIAGDGTSLIVKAIAIGSGKAASHVTACAYSIEYFELKIDSGGNGSVSPSGSVKAAQDDSITVTAAPDNTYAFSHWSVVSGTGIEIADPYLESTSVTMTEGGGEVKANFAVGISLTVTNDGNGTTVPDGEVWVANGVPRTISAAPNQYYQFKQWSVTSGSGVSFDDATSAETRVTLSGDAAVITAEFETLRYNLTMAAATGGSGSPSGTTEVVHGIAQAVNASADSGWVFSHWAVASGSGVSFSDATAASTSVTLTDGDATIEPVFVEERSLTIADDGNGSTTPGAGTHIVGDDVQTAISASPDTGFGFSHWSVSGSASVADEYSSTTTVTLSGGDGAVTANFTNHTYTLTVQNDGYGTTSPAGTSDVIHGVATDISATATAAHYVFDSWSVESGSASFADAGSATTNVTLTSGPATIQANFELETFALKMTDNGFGSTNADADVTYNVPYTITATPDTGYEFDSWQVTSGTASIANSGSVITTVTLTSGSATLLAVFTPLDYTLTIQDDGNGSTSPSGSLTVSHAAETDISAIADENFDFECWTVSDGEAVFGDETSADTTVTLLEGSTIICANFALESYTLTMTDNGFGSTSADATVEYGVPHSITATPDTGYEFNSWQVSSGSGVSFGSSTSASTTVTLTAGPATISAISTPLNYTLTVSDDGHGTTTPSGAQTVSHAASTAISATPDADYGFNYWSIESGRASFDDRYSASTTVTLLYGDATIQANFIPVYTLTVTNDGNGITNPSGSSIVYQNASTNIKATPNSSYSFLRWSIESGSGVVIDELYSKTTNVNLSSEAAEIQANFYISELSVTKLMASDRNGYEAFGSAVSVSNDGSTLVSGAPGEDDSGNNSGAIYIYKWNGISWTETKLLAFDGSYNDKFGNPVSVSDDGNTVVAGAYENESVYIYKWNGGSWDETKLTASDGAYADKFGYSVSVSGDGNVVVVGAVDDDDKGADSGSIYIYKWNGSSWAETKLVASDGEYYDHFGHSVSVSSYGNTVISGASYADGNAIGTGAVYIYKWNGSSWDETKLIASDGTNGDGLGYSVSVSGDGNNVVSGAYYDGAGSVYIYKWNGSSWGETKLMALDGALYDWFGCSVGVSDDGNTVVSGASRDDYNGGWSGSAYIYKWNGSSWDERKLTASDGVEQHHFGLSVGVSGDGNIIVSGAYGDTYQSGSIYIYQ